MGRPGSQLRVPAAGSREEAEPWAASKAAIDNDKASSSATALAQLWRRFYSWPPSDSRDEADPLAVSAGDPTTGILPR